MKDRIIEKSKNECAVITTILRYWSLAGRWRHKAHGRIVEVTPSSTGHESVFCVRVFEDFSMEVKMDELPIVTQFVDCYMSINAVRRVVLSGHPVVYDCTFGAPDPDILLGKSPVTEEIDSAMRVNGIYVCPDDLNVLSSGLYGRWE